MALPTTVTAPTNVNNGLVKITITVDDAPVTVGGTSRVKPNILC